MTKSVLVTGAARGIGRAICAEALARGYKVHALVRRPGSALPGCTEHVADVREREKVKAVLVKLAPELTHFIANAGIEGNFNPRDPRSEEKCLETFEINGTATALQMTVMALEWVRLGARDRVLAVVSSLAAGRGMPGAGPYIATKSAELCMAQAMEGDLRPYGIQVSAIRPGFIRTDLTAPNRFPMPFIMDADRAARIIWNGLERGKYEIAFPKIMWLFCWLRDWVPYPILRWVNLRMGRQLAARGPLKSERKAHEIEARK